MSTRDFYVQSSPFHFLIVSSKHLSLLASKRHAQHVSILVGFFVIWFGVFGVALLKIFV